MRKQLIIVWLLFSSTIAFAALPTPSEIPKQGDCPAKYAAQGSQCVPDKNAEFAFVKYLNCPDAYVEQGNYCVATAGAKFAMRRAAMSCPSGFESVGNYCISEK